jgi:uncharacterized protein YvpB
MTQPTQVRLEVPYRNQVNNLLNPTGSCNVTSLAMCLMFLGVQPRRPQLYEQFEDELYNYAELNGYSRHHGEDLALIAGDYGVHDEFTKHATLEQVKAHLAGDKPCIFHGYFTSFGHIVVVVGYDENGFIVHDPYGEWHSWGYDRNDEVNFTKGKFLHYSYDLIAETCMTGGEFWVHFMGA